MSVVVDTNVLLDVITKDPTWMRPALLAIERALAQGPLIINDVIYAEVSIGLDTVEEVDAVLNSIAVVRGVMTSAALLLAGKAFKRYRLAGGARTGVLPDFFIGAHAQVENLPLLTRDPRRYRTYFPAVHLIAPTA